MIYFNPLRIGEFCCEQTLTENEQLIVDYWNQVNDCVMTNIDAAYKKELFGRDSECSFNAVNNFHYLLSLLLHIKEQVDLDSTLTVSDIYELYDAVVFTSVSVIVVFPDAAGLLIHATAALLHVT